MTTEAYQKLFEAVKKTAIVLDYEPVMESLPTGTSKLGGKPHLPENFVWPWYEGTNYLDEETANRPLSFLAQFNLEDLAAYDADNRLPHKGMLYFFYDLCTMKWGFDPKDRGCARVYFIEDTCGLQPVDAPQELEESLRLLELSLKFSSRAEVPDYGEIAERCTDVEWDSYDEERILCGYEPSKEETSKLLGYADLIQGDMLFECAEIEEGIYCGGIPEFADGQREKLLEKSSEWTLLFQMSTVQSGDYELMFGDCGSIYFYIKKQDLRNRDFEHVWLILQCF